MAIAESKYAYAVSGVHVMEKSLFSMQDMDKLLGAPSYESVVALLAEKGWQISSDMKDISLLLRTELLRTWQWILESAPDASIFYPLIIRKDFHNLKAGIKSLLCDYDVDTYFIGPSVISHDVMKDAITNHDFAALPEPFATLGEETYDLLVRTGDGQSADLAIDRECLSYMLAEAKKSHIPLLIEEAEIFVASADIKTAFRAIRAGKDIEFMTKAVAGCDTLPKDKLLEAAEKGKDALLQYLATTPYKNGVAFLSTQPDAFEKWSDDEKIRILEALKYKSLGPDPLIAFYLYKEAEIKNIRIILAAKQSDLPVHAVKDRLRRLYD